MGTRTKVLINVMTYPLPSRTYTELICTAGVTEEGEWIRLYPIDYRYQPHTRKFRKYQWIDVELEERGDGNDNRKESRKPNLDTMRILGEPLPAGDWTERRAIVDKLPISTVKELRAAYDEDRTSLGMVRPTTVLDLKIEAADKEWKPQWQVIYDRVRLFGPPPKPLKKLPFKFSYVFCCRDSEKPHTAMIEDWELGVLFLNEVDRLGGEEAAAESVKNKYLNDLCHPDRDTHFYMGTTFPYNSWVVLGVYYPPKIMNYQASLFQ